MKRGGTALLVLMAGSGAACTAILGTFDDDGTGGAGGMGTASSTSSSGTTTTTQATTSSSTGTSIASSSGGYPPSCMDHIQDGSETDVDCGGKVCSSCADGMRCLVNADCQSGYCGLAGVNDHRCFPATCNDGMKDGTETDLDCGGGVCPKCGPNKTCLHDSDCLSDCCIGGICF
jgi:hypothetical protein